MVESKPRKRRDQIRECKNNHLEMKRTSYGRMSRRSTCSRVKEEHGDVEGAADDLKHLILYHGHVGLPVELIPV